MKNYLEGVALTMDLETGEFGADVEMGIVSNLNPDSDKDIETGEMSYMSLFNEETGEYEGGNMVPHKNFRVPYEYYTDVEKCEGVKKMGKPVKASKHELELITAAIFLLPTAILFYPLLGIIALTLEVILHNWSHRKNKTLKTDAVYYRSPLHIIAKEFCGRCKEEVTSVKITKIQDIRNDKLKKYGFEYIRRVVT